MFIDDKDLTLQNAAPEGSADVVDAADVGSENPPERYTGSGEHRNPPRMMKIEEIVQWDMNFGVTVGPAGYDHRLRCPYCGKRLLLLFHEGGRDRTGICIAYRCEHCNAHSVVQFMPPGQKPEFPEVAYGERVVVVKPTPIPNDPPERSERSGERANERSNERPGRREREKPPGRNGQAEQKGNQGSSQNGQSPAGGQAQRSNGGPMQRGQQRNAPSPERGEARTETRNEARGEGRDQTRNESRAGARNEGRSETRSSRPTGAVRENGRSQTDGAANTQSQQERPRRPQQQAQAAPAQSNIQEISEVLQEQADKSSVKPRPYQRRRRRPFRPPTSPGNNSGQ